MVDSVNEKDYNKDGFDSEGFSRSGYDKEGYDREGYSKAGYDRNGYDKNGFNRAGYSKDGYDKDGFNRKGFDISGYDRDGFDANGFDKDGYGIDGFDASDFDREGYDRNGYDAGGYNREGYDKDGFDCDGYDADGYDRNELDVVGNAKYDKDGYDKFGYNREGYNKDGYDEKGYDKNGYNRNGLDAEGYDVSGYNAKGVKRDGSVSIKRLHEIFQMYFSEWFCKHGTDIWNLTYAYGDKKTSLKKESDKKFALDMVCGNDYSERDLIHIFVSFEYKVGWAITKDCVCIGGAFGKHRVLYRDIAYSKCGYETNDSLGLVCKSGEKIIVPKVNDASGRSPFGYTVFVNLSKFINSVIKIFEK